ncbi:unnamed protein product, partial [Pylaiella littoralis]
AEEASEGAAAAAAAAAASEVATDAGGDDEPAIPGATVQVLTDDDFERLTQVSTGATTGDWFIEFYAPWCGHCRKLEPAWTELAEKLGGEVNVGKVDVTANKGLGKRFGIKGFPTLLFFSHGSQYKFAGPRKLENLLEYAKGGFKKTDSATVAEPPSLALGLKSVLTDVIKDLKGLKGGKMPTQMTIIVMAGSGLLLMLLFVVMTPSKKSSPTRTKDD